MKINETAVIFIGYQNDYFADDGILRGVIEEPGRTNTVLKNTLALIEALKDTPALLVATPIIFTEDYSELVEPEGILKAIKEAGAFKRGTKGGETIPAFVSQGDRILEVTGKRGLNAFSNTKLDEVLRERQIHDICLAGAVTSICIDSTGRAAFEKGYRVHILSDCTAGRSPVEETFYCETIFPLYAEVIKSADLLSRFSVSASLMHA
jgi:nicotinamidase-related amidase